MHLYRLVTVTNALAAMRRDTANSNVPVEELFGNEGGKRGFEEGRNRERKLEAYFKPCLFWQER